MTYSVRPMTKDDLAQIIEIDREAFPTQWPPANYRRELQNKMAHYIIVRDDSRKTVPERPLSFRQRLRRRLSWPKLHSSKGDQSSPANDYIVGFSGIWLLVDEAHITNIAVRRDYRGRGIGDLLLIATIDLARELKAKIITLEVRASNTIAQNLYRKYGFVQTGLRPGYYLDNHEDAIIMTTEDITSASFSHRIEQLRKALILKLND